MPQEGVLPELYLRVPVGVGRGVPERGAHRLRLLGVREQRHRPVAAGAGADGGCGRASAAPAPGRTASAPATARRDLRPLRLPRERSCAYGRRGSRHSFLRLPGTSADIRARSPPLLYLIRSSSGFAGWCSKALRTGSKRRIASPSPQCGPYAKRRRSRPRPAAQWESRPVSPPASSKPPPVRPHARPPVAGLLCRGRARSCRSPVRTPRRQRFSLIRSSNVGSP